MSNACSQIAHDFHTVVHTNAQKHLLFAQKQCSATQVKLNHTSVVPTYSVRTVTMFVDPFFVQQKLKKESYSAVGIQTLFLLFIFGRLCVHFDSVSPLEVP